MRARSRRETLSTLAILLLLAIRPATTVAQAPVVDPDYANLEVHPDSLVVLPEPTGPHLVGTAIFHWVDADRPETATEDPGDLRQVIAQAWYPAAPLADPVYATYLPELDAMRGGLSTRADSLPRRIAEDLAVLAAVQAHATLDAPVDEPASEPRYPVVVFSPGGNMSRHYHTALMQELASHGYVAVSLSHAYVGWDVFPAGGFVKSTDWGLNHDDPDSAAAAESRLADVLAGDVRLVLDRLADLDREGRFGDRLGLDRVAVAGHSRGVLTVARACETIAVVDACLAFDSIGPDAGARLGRPWLTVRRADWGEGRVERLRAFLSNNPAGARVASIEGASHFTFSDMPIVDPAHYDSSIDPRRGHRIVADLTLAFLAERLLSSPAASLETVVADLPEVELEEVAR